MHSTTSADNRADKRNRRKVPTSRKVKRTRQHSHLRLVAAPLGERPTPACTCHLCAVVVAA